ncbi:MAG TPA: hypothetical protein VMB51_05265 [Solirubrobacteraceae bacterium]|nr:hypothetical protein [Solirubrobacteraceae bacterium]
MAQFSGELPVDSLREALPYLRRPFTADAVRFKVQQAWKEGALIVSYIDARLVAERLNMVCAEQWSDSYENRDGAMICALTVCGVTRYDVGEASGTAVAKALRSDALKRAAVKFGVGVSVYAVPKIILRPNEGLRQPKGKDTWVLTDQGETTCRERYADWLEQKGTETFGVPLDHGDSAGSQGDVEVEPVAAPEPDSSDEEAWPGLQVSWVPPSDPAAAAECAEQQLRESGALDGITNAFLTPEQRAELECDTADLDPAALPMLCLAAGVDSLDDLTQASLPAFRAALEAHAAGVGR